jgi:hypothetical protein
MLFFKIIGGLVAIPVDQHLDPITSNRLRTTNTKHFKQQMTNTEVSRNSLFHRTTKDWNSLTENTVYAETVETFASKSSELLQPGS